jgi:hypothetical protein
MRHIRRRDSAVGQLSAVQQFSSSAVQQFSSSAVQQFSSSAVQQFSSSAVQQFSSSAMMVLLTRLQRIKKGGSFRYRRVPALNH